MRLFVMFSSAWQTIGPNEATHLRVVPAGLVGRGVAGVRTVGVPVHLAVPEIHDACRIGRAAGGGVVQVLAQISEGRDVFPLLAVGPLTPVCPPLGHGSHVIIPALQGFGRWEKQKDYAYVPNNKKEERKL